MTAWLDKLDRLKKREQSVPFGWVKEDGKIVGFCYGGKMFRADGQQHPAGVTDPEFEATYTPQGQPEPWYEAFDLIASQHRPDLEVLVSLAFGSPLLHLPAQYLGIVSAYSQNSGAHKSTGWRVSQAVWGQPQKGIENTSVSDKFLLRKLGFLRNLPMYWDELNDEQRKATIVPLVGQLTQGSEGGKLYSDRRTRAKGAWQLLMGVGLNSSLWTECNKRNKQSDFNLRRIFDIDMNVVEGVERQSDVSRLIESLDDNYGWAGLKYAEFLGTKYDYVHAEGIKILHWFEDELKPMDAERFWLAVCATCFAGAKFANEALGIKFNLAEMAAFLTGQFVSLRKRINEYGLVAGAITTTEDLLNAFVKAKGENQIWCQNPPMRGRSSREFVCIWQEPDVRFPKPIHIRWNTGPKLLMLSQAEFTKFAVEQGYTPEQALKGLQTHYQAEINVRRKNLATGTGRGASETVIEIALQPGMDLYENMMAPVPKDQQKPDLTVAVNNAQEVLAQAIIQTGQSEGSPESEPNAGSQP